VGAAARLSHGTGVIQGGLSSASHRSVLPEPPWECAEGGEQDKSHSSAISPAPVTPCPSLPWQQEPRAHMPAAPWSWGHSPGRNSQSWPQPFAQGRREIPQKSLRPHPAWASTIITSPHPHFSIQRVNARMLSVSKKGAYQKQLCLLPAQKGSPLPVSSGQEKAVCLPTRAVGPV